MPIRLNGTTSGYTELSAPATAGSNTLTLPTGNGTNGQYLQTNGSGALSWASVTSSQWTTSGSNVYYTGGSVGVNVTSPAVRLHIEANDSEALRLAATGANQSIWSRFIAGSPNAADLRVGVDSATGAVTGHGAAGFVWNAGNAGISFGTNNTERMRITNSGNVGIGVSPSYRFDVAGSAANSYIGFHENTANTADDNVYLWRMGANANSASATFLYCQTSTTQRIGLRGNGGIANYSANNVNLSDRNAKKDIAPAAGTWDCLKEWEIVNFRYKDQPDDADLNMGVIAQQVAESCPEVITVFQEATEDQPEKLGVKDQQMMWMAIKALQEAQLRIETLEASNAALESRIAALEVTP